MNIVVIQARMGSTRLPGKVLKKLNGIPMLLFLINRVKLTKNIDKIIIATTNNKNDLEIINFCRSNAIDYFCGNEHDVLDRYYHCALKYKAKNIIRITADCPLIDPIVIDNTIKLFNNKKVDFAANTIPPETRKWPDGSDVEVFSFKALEKAYLAATKEEREHVTFYMWRNNPKIKKIQLNNNYDWSKYRYTIDYPEDYEKVKKIINILNINNEFGYTEEIIKIIESNKDMQSNNKKFKFGHGWKNNK